jgi:hypothetical protein
VRIYRNKKGWWNSTLHKKWLQYNWGLRASKHTHPILLLVDDFSGHWTNDVLEYAKSINVHCLKIPEGYTSTCSPPDISWNGPIKRRLRKRWLDNLLDQFKNFKNAKDGEFMLKKPDRRLVIKWVKDTWDEIGNETILSGFSSKTKIIERAIHADDANQFELRDDEVKEMNELVDNLINLRLNDDEFTIYNHDEDLFNIEDYDEEAVIHLDEASEADEYDLEDDNASDDDDQEYDLEDDNASDDDDQEYLDIDLDSDENSRAQIQDLLDSVDLLGDEIADIDDISLH